MNFFEFIASLVSSLIWPTLVVIFVIAYRREIGGGLERLSNRVIHARSTDDIKHLFDGLRPGTGKSRSGAPHTGTADTGTADTSASDTGTSGTGTSGMGTPDTGVSPAETSQPGTSQPGTSSPVATRPGASRTTATPGAGGFEAEFAGIAGLLSDSAAGGPAAVVAETPNSTETTESGGTGDDATDGVPTAGIPTAPAAVRPGLFERMSQVAVSTEPKTAVLLAASALAGELRDVTGTDDPPVAAIHALKARKAITRETALTLRELVRLGDLADHDRPELISPQSAAGYLAIVDTATTQLRDETGAL